MAFDASFVTTARRPKRPLGRLSRAALFALGTGAAVAATTDCASDETDSEFDRQHPESDASDNRTLYGGPAVDSGPVSPPDDASPDAPSDGEDAADAADAADE